MKTIDNIIKKAKRGVATFLLPIMLASSGLTACAQSPGGGGGGGSGGNPYVPENTGGSGETGGEGTTDESFTVEGSIESNETDNPIPLGKNPKLDLFYVSQDGSVSNYITTYNVLSSDGKFIFNFKKSQIPTYEGKLVVVGLADNFYYRVIEGIEKANTNLGPVRLESYPTEGTAQDFYNHFKRINCASPQEREEMGIEGNVNRNPFPGLKKWKNLEEIFISPEFSVDEQKQIKGIIEEVSGAKIHVEVPSSYEGIVFIRPSTTISYTVLDDVDQDGYINSAVVNIRSMDSAEHEIKAHGILAGAGHSNSATTPAIYAPSIWAFLSTGRAWTEIDNKIKRIVEEETFKGMEKEDNILGIDNRWEDIKPKSVLYRTDYQEKLHKRASLPRLEDTLKSSENYIADSGFNIYDKGTGSLYGFSVDGKGLSTVQEGVIDTSRKYSKAA